MVLTRTKEGIDLVVRTEVATSSLSGAQKRQSSSAQGHLFVVSRSSLRLFRTSVMFFFVRRQSLPSAWLFFYVNYGHATVLIEHFKRTNALLTTHGQDSTGGVKPPIPPSTSKNLSRPRISCADLLLRWLKAPHAWCLGCLRPHSMNNVMLF